MTAFSEKLACFQVLRYGNWSLAFLTRILSTQHSRMPVPSEVASTGRNAAHGMRHSPARPRSWKWHTTRAKNSRKSTGKRKRLFLTSISSLIFEARFMIFAATNALEIVWMRAATKHPNIWPESFLREDQPALFTRACGTKAERASSCFRPALVNNVRKGSSISITFENALAVPEIREL